jgi:integrase
MAPSDYPIDVRATYLGHATIAITLDTYSHAIPAMREEAEALIAGLVSSR